MPKYVLIPKILEPRESMNYRQKIPKIIWQTMKTSRIPVIMSDNANTWIGKNPEYEYRLFDDTDILNFIQKEFPAYLKAYKKIKYGASKADLWRYLIIYKYGGVYADIDCRCIIPLREWIHPDAEIVTQLGINKDLCQWLIISVPQNPIFLKAAQKSLQHINNNICIAEYSGFEFQNEKLTIRKNEPLIKVNHKIMSLAGPPVLQMAAEDCLREGSIESILQYTQVLCVSAKTSCQMNGNVTHDSGNSEYKKALNMLNTRHYDGFISRMLRKF